MDKSFCKRIDDEFLVEEYVAGKLFGELREQFEQHISECEEHANALALEKALRRGVREFARNELKSRIRSKVRKRDDIRLIVLRFAAFLFVAVITPLILYYQFGILQQESEQSLVPESTSKRPVIATETMEVKESEQSKEIQKTVAEVPMKRTVSDDLSEGAGLTAEPVMPEVSDEADAVGEIELQTRDELKTSVYQSVESPKALSKQRTVGVRGVSLPAEREESSLMVFTLDDSLQLAVPNRISLQLKLYQKDIHDCLQSLLEAKENNEYHLLVEFILRTDGKTQSVKIIKTDIELKDAQVCIEAKIRNWTFPPGEADYRVQKLFDSRHKQQY